MAQTAVDIVVKVAGGQKLKQLDASLRGTAANSIKASSGLDKSAKSAQNLGNKAKQAKSGVDKLTGAVKGLLAATVLINSAKFVIGKTAELETQARSLKVLTGELETAERIIGRLQQFAAVTPFTSSELIETSKRLAAFGVDTEKLVDTTKRLADVSGATGARLTEVATAYGQIQAKGRLQGEELLQLQERGIGLQDELQKMYGLTGQEFSKALQKGQFSAEAVEVAIKRLTEAGGKYADGAISQSDTLAGKFSTLIDGIENIARTLGNVLSPALKTILDQAIGVVNSINAALAAGQRMQQFGIDAGQRNDLFKQAGKDAEQIAKLRGGGKIDPAEFTRLRDERFKDLIEDYGYRTGKVQVEIEPVITENNIPELLKQNTKTKTGGGKTGGSGSKAADQLQRQLDAGAKLAQQFERAKALRAAETDLQEKLLKSEYERQDVIERINETAAESQRAGLIALANSEALAIAEEIKSEQATKQLEAYQDVLGPLEDQQRLLEAKLNGTEKEEALQQKINAAIDGRTPAEAAYIEQVIRGNAALEERLQKQEAVKAQISEMTGVVAGELTSAFKSVIDGSKSAQEALADAFKNIGDAFIDMALKIIQQQLVLIANGLIMKALGVSMPSGGGFGSGASAPLTSGLDFSSAFSSGGFGISGFADGGVMQPNSVALVGERGPEFISSGPQPLRVTNHESSRAAMAQYSPANERAPQAMAPANYNFNTIRIADEEYVSRDQLTQAMNQASASGAKVGEQRAMNRLRQSRSTRTKLGM